MTQNDFDYSDSQPFYACLVSTYSHYLDRDRYQREKLTDTTRLEADNLEDLYEQMAHIRVRYDRERLKRIETYDDHDTYEVASFSSIMLVLHEEDWSEDATLKTPVWTAHVAAVEAARQLKAAADEAQRIADAEAIQASRRAAYEALRAEFGDVA